MSTAVPQDIVRARPVAGRGNATFLSQALAFAGSLK